MATQAARSFIIGTIISVNRVPPTTTNAPLKFLIIKLTPSDSSQSNTPLSKLILKKPRGDSSQVKKILRQGMKIAKNEPRICSAIKMSLKALTLINSFAWVEAYNT